MNERLIVMDFEQGEVGVTLGDNFRYISVPYSLTIVAVSCSPSVDNATLTIDINDDGTGVITAVACATKATPGEWNSTHVGGTETPVRIAAGSVISFDANNAAADTVVHIQIYALVGEKTG